MGMDTLPRALRTQQRKERRPPDHRMSVRGNLSSGREESPAYFKHGQAIFYVVIASMIIVRVMILITRDETLSFT
jgi:hypothetical protein